jgi:peptidoglycan/LPS O-acetylase OafA/YrhL
MNARQSTRTINAPRSGNLLLLARHYLVSRRALAALAIVAIASGIALNWGWLVTAGIAPVLLTALPCVVMCGLGLCMNKLVGKSCAPQSTGPAGVADPTDPPAAIDAVPTDRPT